MFHEQLIVEKGCQGGMKNAKAIKSKTQKGYTFNVNLDKYLTDKRFCGYSRYRKDAFNGVPDLPASEASSYLSLTSLDA